MTWQTEMMAMYLAISNCFRSSMRAIALMAVLGSVLAGCGSGEVRGRIVGKITFQGKPLSEGLVFFSNNDNGTHMSGEVKSDGSYEIITAKGAGLPLGVYQVRVRPPLEPLPSGPSRVAPKPKEYPNIPSKYRDFGTSGLTLTVKEGANPLDIDMQP
jgi:hypothetical protein